MNGGPHAEAGPPPEEPVMADVRGEGGTGPLAGWRVIVTRPADRAGELLRRLRAAGAIPIAIPLIRIEPPLSWEPVDAAVAALDRYDWVLFTSANAVGAFLQRWRERGGAWPATCRIACVGAATAAALAPFGLRADLVPDRAGGGDALLRQTAGRIGRGSRVLLPRSAIALETVREGLGARGALVDAVTVYRTVTASEAAAPLRRCLSAGKPTILTLFSPSAVQSFIQLVGEEKAAAETVVVACIGETTASAAARARLPVRVVAAAATADHLVEALIAYARSPAGARGNGADALKERE